jgi:hypothetical protein
MKTLKEFMAKRKYVAVQYDATSQKQLRDWAEENGFDLTTKYNGDSQPAEDFDFHTTIFFTTNEVNLRNREYRVDPTAVEIIGFDLLGENRDIPVLKLKVAGGIRGLREHYASLGLRDQWPSYKPHISVSYAKQSIDLNSIKLPKFTPRYDRVVIKDIED